MIKLYNTLILRPTLGLFCLIGIAISVYLLSTPYYHYALLPGLLILFLLLLAHSPQLGFYVIVFMIPYESFRVFTTPFGSLSVSKVVAFWIAISILFYSLPNKRYSLNIRSNLWPWLLVFFLISSVSAVFSDYPSMSLHSLRRLLVAYVFFALTLSFISLQDFCRRLPAVLILSVSFSVLLSLVGYILDIPLFTIDMDLEPQSTGRLIGTVYNPNHYAFMLLFCLPLLVQWIFSSSSPTRKLLALALFFMNIIGIILTYSRGGAIVLTVVLSLIFFQHLRKFNPKHLGFVGALGVVAFVIIVISLPSSYWSRQKSIRTGVGDSSIMGRISYLYVGWDSFKKNPVLGSGPGTFNQVYAGARYAFTPGYSRTKEDLRRDAHNTYLEVTVGTGIPGLAVFLTIVWFTLRNFHLAIKHFRFRGNQEMVSLVIAYRLSFFSILTYFFMLSRLSHKFFWLSLALSQVALRLSQEETGEERSENAASGK